MKKLMTYETLRSFAYVNDAVCTRPIRGVVLNFFGLGGQDMYRDEINEGMYCGERGLLYVVPYNNPWAWMNRQAVDYTDEVVDLLFRKYGLPEDLPILSTGGSMGGLSALVYCRYAKRTPTACIAVCPVCDLPYHFTERPDLPRTLYSAYWHEEDLEEALRAHSPLHLAGEMPKIPYTVFHTDDDHQVNIEKHTERFVRAMAAAGHPVEYFRIHGYDHCRLPDEEWEHYKQEIFRLAGV